MPTLRQITEAVSRLKSSYALQKVSIFGSYADGRADENSDLDLMVEFTTPAVSLIQLNSLKFDLEDALGLPVDVVHAPIPKDSMLEIGKVVPVL